jgi:hypothetical protein
MNYAAPGIEATEAVTEPLVGNGSNHEFQGEE